MLGDTTSYITNEVGNVTRVTDPDIGQQDYAYDGLGQLLSHTRNQSVTSYQYDALGRRKHVSSTIDGTLDFVYDGDGTELTLIGHLQSQTVTSATLGNASTSYEYKNPGASVSAIHRIVEGQTFDTTIEADALGRMGTIHFPAPSDRPLAVTYQYEPTYGRLTSVQNAADLQPLWALQAIDSFGNASKIRYANGLTVSRSYQPATGKVLETSVKKANGSNFLTVGLTYDERGLLETRSTKEDAAAVTMESFVHDALDRLKSHTRASGAVEAYDYDLKGNLTLSPTLGVLHYEEPGPHQVTRTDDGRSFGYLDGNQITRRGTSVPGGEQHISYTAFDLPYQLATGPESTSTERVLFHYDASHKRVAQISQQRVGQQWQDKSRTLYAGDLYRQTETVGGGAVHTVRIPTPDGLVIEVTLKPGNGHEFRFLQTAYLGSVLYGRSGR